MKASTAGLLAIAAMGVTGIVVWQATRPDADVAGQGGAAPIEPIVVAERDKKAEPAGAQVFDEWHFQYGKTLVTEGRLGHPSLYVDQDNETYIYVSTRVAKDAVATKPAPLNVAVVIDRSGSMVGKRLDNAIAAARGMVRRLRDGDAVSVITYNTQTDLLVPVTTVDQTSRQEVIDKIDGITAVGDTCISCAIDAASDVVGRRDGMVNRILLLSDGQATAGVRDVAGFRRIAEGVRQRNCSISSVGVDVDYNERIMTALAMESNGRHYFVDKSDELKQVFDRELESLVSTVARNAELHVDLAPGVEITKVFDRSYRQDGNRLIVPFGIFAAGDHKSVLVRVSVAKGPVGRRAVADVRLVFDDLSGRDDDKQTGKLLTWMVADQEKASELDPLVAGRVSRSETTATLNEANALFDRGKYKDAAAKLDGQRKEVRSKRKDFEAAAPAKRRDELREDFDQQLAALDDAHDGFSKKAEEASRAAKAKGRPAAPNKTRAGRAQVRANAYDAFDMAL